MKLSFICLISLCLIPLLLASDSNNCEAFQVNYTLYDLCPLASNPLFTSTLKTAGAETVYFTLGSPHLRSCDNSRDIWGEVKTVGGGCSDIATQTPKYDFINQTAPENGVVITFPEQQVTGVVTRPYQLVVTLECDQNALETDQVSFITTDDSFLSDKRVIHVKGSSKHACPVFSFNQILNFIHKHKNVFAAIFGIVGLIMTFLGLKLFSFTQFIIATVLGIIGFSSVLFLISGVVTAVWVSWTITIFSIIFGLIMGYLAVKYWKVSYFIVGAGLGIVGAIVLYEGAIYPLVEGKSYQVVLFIILLIVSAVVAGALAVWLGRTVIMVATSVIGAYAVVRAISVFAGGFPSEGDITQGLRSFNAVVYAYLVAIIVLAVLGFMVQRKLEEKDKAEKTVATGPYYNRV